MPRYEFMSHMERLAHACLIFSQYETKTTFVAGFMEVIVHKDDSLEDTDFDKILAMGWLSEPTEDGHQQYVLPS